MSELLSWFWRSKKRWLYGFLALICTLSFHLIPIKVTYGASWAELLLRGIQVIQLATISDKQEVQLGKQINQQVTQQVKILNNSQINSYLDRIGQELAKTSQRPNIPYTFQVVDDENINAFATMGGFVYINSGLMLTADNEAELASVVGHEIGHIVGRHAIQQMRQRAISQGLLSAAGLDTSQAVQIGVELALSRPNSREDELEADRFGLANIEKAGYAPIGMVSFMEKLLQKGNSIPSFLSTHPATADRITALEQAIEPQTASAGKGLDAQTYKNKISSLS